MLAMNWFRDLTQGSVAWGLAMLALAITMGLALGTVRIRGIKLGVSGVLFSALVFGQLGLSIEDNVLAFLRDFALIIFVYALGLQVGPGFLTSLREEGLRLNVLAICAVALGGVFTWMVAKWGHIDFHAASGLYAGAFTTTPGLAAGQDALKHISQSGEMLARNLAVTGLAYTVTYPFGIVGPILAVALLRRMFNVNIHDERAKLLAADEVKRPPIAAVSFEVTRDDLIGVALRDLAELRNTGVIFSRLLRAGELSTPNGETALHTGDVFRAVGPRTAVARVVKSLGKATNVDLDRSGGDHTRVDLVVTRTQVLRKTLRELNLIRRAGVTVVRVNRSGIELAPKASLRIQFGDHLTVVGPEAGVKAVEEELGNSADTLNRPQLIPLFLGIVLGVAVGSIPIIIPGLDTRLQIGLAGGPMIAAILLAQLGNIGSVVWYMPVASNTLFRDFGLAVFLACVGLMAGHNFLENLTGSTAGLVLIGWGLAITMLPVLILGAFARMVLKMNFFTLAGWVAGAMTSSPALLFADELTGSDAPALAYAAVAPLSLLTPILCAQLLVVLLAKG